MAFDFPNAPTDGQVYSPSGGPDYVWRTASGAWEIQTGGTNSAFVAKAGDTMSGSLIIRTAAPYVILDNQGAAASGISLTKNNVNRFAMELNGAGDWQISRFADDGSYLGASVVLVRANNSLHLPSSVSLDATAGLWTTVTLNKVSGMGAVVQGAINGITRWQLALGDQTPETGGNAGSNFTVARMNDAGVYLDSPIQIDRASGQVTVGLASNYVRIPSSVVLGDALVIQSAGPVIYMDSPVNNTSAIYARHSPSYATRWGNLLACDAESGGNVGSNWYLGRYADGGGLIDYPIQIVRQNAWTTFTGNVSASYHISNGGLTKSVWSNAPCVAAVSSTNWLAAAMWYENANSQIAIGYGDGNGFPYQAKYICNNADFVLLGQQAWKNGGGPWADNSDARIKNVLGNYESGLEAILALQPVRYTYKGNDTPAETPPSNRTVPVRPPAPPRPAPEIKVEGDFLASDEERSRATEPDDDREHATPYDPKWDEPAVVPYPNSRHYQNAVDQKEFIGLVAQDAEPVMPELISKATGMIDGVAVDDLRSMDTGPLMFALVNAVKELSAQNTALAARVAQLEAA
jgi:hypothetical protein